MSFARHNLEKSRDDLERNRVKVFDKIQNISGDFNVFASAVDMSLEWLTEAYAEIDRLTAENADLQSKNDDLYKKTGLMMNRIETLESAKHQLAFERDKLAAELDELRGKQAELVWKCPVSLKDGEYRWSGESLHIPCGFWDKDRSLSAFRDWTDPPRKGVWRVVEPGKAVWVRE